MSTRDLSAVSGGGGIFPGRKVGSEQTVTHDDDKPNPALRRRSTHTAVSGDNLIEAAKHKPSPPGNRLAKVCKWFSKPLSEKFIDVGKGLAHGGAVLAGVTLFAVGKAVAFAGGAGTGVAAAVVGSLTGGAGAAAAAGIGMGVASIPVNACVYGLSRMIGSLSESCLRYGLDVDPNSQTFEKFKKISASMDKVCIAAGFVTGGVVAVCAIAGVIAL